jgi:hypothetical protein
MSCWPASPRNELAGATIVSFSRLPGALYVDDTTTNAFEACPVELLPLGNAGRGRVVTVMLLEPSASAPRTVAVLMALRLLADPAGSTAGQIWSSRRPPGAVVDTQTWWPRTY